MIFLKILFAGYFIQLTPIDRLPSYHATSFGGGYAFSATLKVTPGKYFDSVHALLCTKRHDGYDPIYRHLPDRAQSGAGVLSIHPSQGEGRDRLSFSSNRRLMQPRPACTRSVPLSDIPAKADQS